jgi:HK97 family phage major capsid protein
VNHPIEDRIARLEKTRNANVKLQQTYAAIGDMAKLSAKDKKDADKISANIAEFDQRIAESREELVRSGYGDPIAARIVGGRGDDGNGQPFGGSADPARDWARRAADKIWAANRFGDGESRAITSSAIDLPTLVLPNVVAMDRPKRVIDLLVDRQEVPSNAFEYWQQTVRTNNATFVADLASKPTSVFTVSPVEDRLRVLAHLSEQIPNRLWLDYSELQNFLISELYQGLLDALEAQVLSGNGTGENFEGILNASGTTAVSFNTDVLTTLRGALTAFETAGIQATGWVLNPADAAAIDLLREETTPSLFVTGGYLNGPVGSNNIFGSVPRLISPRVPAGTALLADWTKVRLFTKGGIMTMADPFTGFSTNTTLLRSEMRIGMGLLRPSDFAIITLTS